MNKYNELKGRMISGWNTWSTWSMLSHTLMPQGATVSLCLKNYNTGAFLRRALMDRESIQPGVRNLKGDCSSLEIDFEGAVVTVKSALSNGELILSVSAEGESKNHTSVFFEFSFLWNKPGRAEAKDDHVALIWNGGETVCHMSGLEKADLNVPCGGPYKSYSLERPVYFNTGEKLSGDECKNILERGRETVAREAEAFGPLSDCYNGLNTVMVWDTIYEPSKDRVISPVSRYWNAEMHGGWVLFVWDTYFAGSLASVFSKELAYANTIEITKEILPQGYIGIMNCPINKGTDRSQPPVGTMSVMGLYNRYGEKWLLEELFDDLLAWNRWWPEKRSVGEGLLGWGYNEGFTSTNANFESGLDNSPLYDDAPFNEETLVMDFADVGLISLYAMDCRLLADAAEVLKRNDERKELLARAEKYEKGLNSLWNEEKGIYLNKNTRTGEYSQRLAPTLLYPLLTEAPDEEKARRLVEEHLMNPEEFKGPHMIPSIARNDKAYADQDYWRGRIWGPMNWLVYLALKKRGFAKEAAYLSEKSKELFLKEWLEMGHVHENYHGDLGTGCSEADDINVGGSDSFYHWGALLALIPLIEEGYVPFDPWGQGKTT